MKDIFPGRKSAERERKRMWQSRWKSRRKYRPHRELELLERWKFLLIEGVGVGQLVQHRKSYIILLEREKLGPAIDGEKRGKSGCKGHKKGAGVLERLWHKLF